MSAQHIGIAIVFLFASFHSFKLAYKGIVNHNLENKFWLTELLNAPRSYYEGKRGVRAGVLNLIAGLGFLFGAIYYLSNERLKFSLWILISAIGLISLISCIIVILDSPFKKK